MIAHAWLKPALALATAAGLLLAGYQLGTRQGELALEQLRRQQAEQRRADALAAALADQQREHRTTRDHLQKEVTRVSSLYRKALDAAPEPVPACVFTRGWVRLYDRATGAELPAADADSAGAAASPARADAAEQLDSGINQSGLLAHHIDYAEQCRNTAAQLDRLIDLLETR